MKAFIKTPNKVQKMQNEVCTNYFALQQQLNSLLNIWNQPKISHPLLLQQMNTTQSSSSDLNKHKKMSAGFKTAQKTFIFKANNTSRTTLTHHQLDYFMYGMGH